MTFIRTNLPQMSLRVSAEGTVVNSSIGVFDLRGKTLTQARSILAGPLGRQFNAREFDISVIHPLAITILLSGEVVHPGLYQAYSSERVSDVLTRAGGVKPTGSTRHIRLQGGPQPLDVDLDAAVALGLDSVNPFLYAGTQITVPPRSPDRIQVIGDVNTPREIELKPGDDLNSLVMLAGGARTGADLSRIEILGRPAGDRVVKSGDIIRVPKAAESDQEKEIALFGEVATPGEFVYAAGLTLGQVIQKAGGLTSSANEGRITIFRRAESDEWGAATVQRYPIVSGAAGGELFNATLLSPADSIIVPRKLGFVKVSGFVSSPGLLPFVPGKTALYYIGAAGGFLPTADVRVVGIHDRVSGLTQSNAPGASVSDGDEIQVREMERLK